MLCNNQGTQAFLKVINGWKIPGYNREEGPARLCHNQVTHALEEEQRLIICDYASLSRLCHNQVVQALVGQQRLKIHGIYCEEGL